MATGIQTGMNRGSRRAISRNSRHKPEIKTHAQAPYSLLFFLLAVVGLHAIVTVVADKSPPLPQLKTSATQSELRQIVDSRIRLLEGPDCHFLVSPKLTDPQDYIMDKVLEEQGLEVLGISVKESWPEYLGYSLWVLLGSLLLFYLVTWTQGQWTKELRDSITVDRVLILASMFGAYGLTASLGWVCLSPGPFWGVYLALCLIPTFRLNIPVQVRQKRPWFRALVRSGKGESEGGKVFIGDALEAIRSGKRPAPKEPPAPGKKLQINPYIEKMFEKGRSLTEQERKECAAIVRASKIENKRKPCTESNDHESKISIGEALAALRSGKKLVRDPKN